MSRHAIGSIGEMIIEIRTADAALTEQSRLMQKAAQLGMIFVDL